MTFHYEHRWKTRRNVFPGELSTVLNNLSFKGWKVYSIMPQSAYRFIVVARREVKVYNT